MMLHRMPPHGGSPHRRRDQRGAAAIEFALVMIPLIALLLGTLEFGYYFFAAQSASSAARETARRLIVGDCQGSLAQTFAQHQANLSGLTLTYGTSNGPGTSTIAGAGTLPAVPGTLRVSVTANGGIVNLYPLPNSGTITRIVDARMEDADSSGAAC